MSEAVDFARELERVVPLDMPHRQRLIEKSAHHLQLVAQANAYMNLTRIATPEEAAIKHVLDCVLPWRHFANARLILDTGTGAGFPGLPLALVLPETRFLLTDSTGKKARFVETVAEALDLSNVDVLSERAEALAISRHPPIITARAVGPAERLVDLFAKPLAAGSQLLLYKGPDVAAELRELNGQRFQAEIVDRYELPSGFGARTLVRIVGAAPRRKERPNPR